MRSMIPTISRVRRSCHSTPCRRPIPDSALLNGRWKDIGKFKGSILRGVVAHPPYFHNGSAATLEDAIEFYDTRFTTSFSAREKRDLVAFVQ